MNIKMKRLLALLLCSLVFLSACAQDGGDDTDTPDTPDTPSTGDDTQPETSEKVLTFATPYTIDTFVPYEFSSDGDRYVISNIYESLIENDTGSFIPGLAAEWSYPDETSYEFKLRDNAYWQTGNDLFGDEKVQVTAHDVKAVFDYVMDEANQVRRRADFGNLESYEVVDDFTIRFTTVEPDAMFMSYLSGVQIFPMKAIEEGFDLNEMPVGSGPYKFSEYKVDDHIELVKNPDFFIEPGLDKLIFKIIPDKAVAAIALRNGEVDIVPQLLSTDLQAVADEDFLSLVPNSAGWYRYLGFNTTVEMFQDLDVRLAIRKAIDFEGITEAIFKNSLGTTLAIPAYGPVPPEFLGYDPDAWKAEYDFDPAEAVTLLEGAGWAKNSDGIYEKDGETLSFVIKTPANDPNRMKFGDMCATYLKQIGMDVSTQPTEWATHLSDIQQGNTEMFIMGGGSTMNGQFMLFHSTGADGQSHNTFYDDPDLDVIIDEAFRTIDDAKREQLLKQSSLLAVQNAVHAGGYVEYVQYGINDRVTGFGDNPTTWYGFTTATRNVSVTD